MSFFQRVRVVARLRLGRRQCGGSNANGIAAAAVVRYLLIGGVRLVIAFCRYSAVIRAAAQATDRAGSVLTNLFH